MFKLSNGNPIDDKTWKKNEEQNKPKTIKSIRDANVNTELEKNPELKDFYNTYNPYEAEPSDKEIYKQFTASLTKEEKKFVNANDIYIQVDVENVGGLIMPLIFKLEYADGTSEIVRVPVEIWQSDNNKLSKVFVVKKDVKGVILDPYREIADTDMSNNYWPPRIIESRFELYKRKTRTQKNPMQKKK